MPGFPVIVGHNTGKLPGNQTGPHGSVHKLGHVRSVNLEVEISIDAVSSSEGVGGITKIQLKEVPLFLINAFKIISQSSNLVMEGLFRKEGNAARINRNNLALYTGEIDFASHSERFTVHDICSMVKRFFRDLKVPLIYGLPLKKKLFSLGQKALSEEISRTDITALFDAKRDENGKLVAPLEQCHLGTLGFLMRQLHWIAQHSSQHQMTAENLATIFAPSLFRDEAARKKPKEGRRGSHEDLLSSARSETDLRIAAVKLLIEKANWIGLPTNFYLTSGKQRSASLAPTSPRYPLVHDMVNVTKENTKVASKRQSMKLPRSKEDGGHVSKANERRSSSTLRELFSFNRLRRRSNSRERVPDRRRTVEVKSTIYPLVPQTKQHSKPPSPAQKYILDIQDDSTPISNSGAQGNTSSSRLSRSQQQRRGRQSTPGPSDKNNESDITPRGARARKTGSRHSTSSSDVNGESKSKLNAANIDTIFGEEAFDAETRKERQPRRRRHTTPVKNIALRRNQPNSQHSGLRLPKRRVTLTAREEHEKENDPKRRSLSADRSYILDIENGECYNDSRNSTTNILEQRGYESRMRRLRMNRRKESASIMASNGNRVDAATSPMVIIANENTTTPLRSVGSATVSEKVVVSTHNDVTPQQLLEQLYSPHPGDIPDSTTRRCPTKTPPCSPKKTTISCSPQISSSGTGSLTTPDIRSPDPPPLPGAPPPFSTACVFRPQLVAQHSLDAQLSRAPPENPKTPLQKVVSVDRKEKPAILPKPSSLTKNSPLQRRGVSMSCIGQTHSPCRSIGDDDFADSDAIRQKILSSTTGDWNMGSRKTLDQRPSVAFIRNHNCGMVRDRVNLFSQMNVMETISGRSSAMSNRTSLGGNSTISDLEEIKPSAPPVGHGILMGRRSTSSILSTTFISPNASPRPS